MSTYVLAGGIRRGAAERMVVAATMAPALHGIQAWRFKVLPGLIEVQADPARFRTMADPHGRSLHIGCGAVLFNLRLAAAQLGHEPVVRPLPDRSRPMLLASVRLPGPHRTSAFERLLYAATLRPVPARQPYGDQRPPQPVITELAEAARLEGAILHPTTASSTTLDSGTIKGVTADSAALDSSTARPPDADSDSATVHGGTIHPAVADTHVLATRGDGPAEWLRAGQALQRILLTGASRAVATSFLYEVTPLPSPAPVHLESGDIPQALIQFGRSAFH